MKRQIQLAIIASLAAVALWATDVAAQANHRTVQRYNKVARGKNVAEWHRRLFSPDAKIRLEAVESLGNDGTEASVKPLLDATTDKDPRVRAKAIEYLGAIGSPTATPVLTQYLFLNDFDRNSKKYVLVALGRIGDTSAVQRLVDFVTNSDDEELRCGALHALGEFASPRALDAVKPYTKSEDPHESRIARDAMAKINGRLAARANAQPTIIELERLLTPPKQGKR